MTKIIKIKISYWVSIFGLMGLFIIKNWNYFFETTTVLNLNLFSFEKLKHYRVLAELNPPPLNNAFIFLTALLFGMGIVFFYLSIGLFKSKKNIKTLKIECEVLKTRIAELEEPELPPEAQEQ